MESATCGAATHLGPGRCRLAGVCVDGHLKWGLLLKTLGPGSKQACSLRDVEAGGRSYKMQIRCVTKDTPKNLPRPLRGVASVELRYQLNHSHHLAAMLYLLGPSNTGSSMKVKKSYEEKVKTKSWGSVSFLQNLIT